MEQYDNYGNKIELDLTKHYLMEEPFFIVDKNSGEVHILRMANEDALGRTVK